MYIQLIGVVSFFFLLISYLVRKKEDILQYQLIAYMIYAIHYLLLGAYTGSVLALTLLSASFLGNNKVKHPYRFVIFFTVVYSVIGIITFDKWFCVLPVIACIIATLALIYGNKLALKLSSLMASICWGIYSLFVHSYAGFYSNIILALFIVYLLVKEDIYEK